jgi:chemotaxis protein histidine kinase CheA/ActR/RegA family two-component response regulator
MAASPMTPFLAEMRKELALAGPDFGVWLGTISTASSEDAAFMEAFESYGGQVERIGMTAEMLGMPGVNTWCGHLNAMLMSVATLEANERAQGGAYLRQWPALLDSYLSAPADFDASLALAEYLTMPAAPQPLDETAGIELIGQLTTEPVLPGELLADMEAANKPAEVTGNDVSLVLAEDADRDVYNAFIAEAPGSLATFAELTSHIARGDASIDDFRNAKRIAHSLKGSASIVGLRGITSLGHYTEDVLEFFEQNPIKPPRAIGIALADASDCLSQMVGFLQGEEEEPENAFAVLNNMVAWANKIKAGELEGDVEHAELATAVAHESTNISANANNNSVAAESSLPFLAAKPAGKSLPKASGDQDPSLRVPIKTVDELFRLVGELTTKLGQLENRVTTANSRAKGLLKQNITVQQRVLDLEKMVLLRGLSLHKPNAEDDSSTFDPLELDRYNELHGATRSLVEVCADAREISIALEDDVANIQHDLTQQNQINKDLRFQVISTRMTPVESLAARLTRNVRQTCQQTGKDAELTITGRDILVDGDVLNKLADPLLHILRNAVDHGIEEGALRESHGKSPRGLINLDFTRQGSSVTVHIKDDGKGLDYARIRDKALMNGLISAEQSFTHAELARLTLLPGFSTRDAVTEISGRGVGMDVVVSRLHELKGSVEIHSEFGQGCEVTLRFQASLITQQSLLVESALQVFAIPIHNIEQALSPLLGEVVRDGSDWKLRLNEVEHEVIDLAKLSGYPSAALNKENIESHPKVLIRVDGTSVAVLVDKVIDSRDLIVKNMGRYLPKVHGISGAALLGDGTVVPLLDVPSLLAKPVAVSSAAAQLAQAALKQTRRVLVVDDSLSVRKSLTQLLEDSAYEVVGAGDGLEAIRILEKFRPHVICTDLEMPNMNGLELTEHLRRREDTRELPIIMITSRSMDKHRDQAKRAGVDFYVTKPYTDAELLQQVRQAMQTDVKATAEV